MASGANKFKFISPGVFINEIDRSQIPRLPTAIGPVVIGRTRQGPGMRPVKVSSFEEFTRVFGSPDPGADGSDNWRENNFDGPTYAAYAAQAWLASGQAPVTMVRLLGTQHINYSANGQAGWTFAGFPQRDEAKSAGAFGIFLINSSSTVRTAEAGPIGQVRVDQVGATGSLAAVIYCTGSNITLSGTVALNTASAAGLDDAYSNSITGAAAALIQSTGDGREFQLTVREATDNSVIETITFNFNRNSPRYIRKVLNTNPARTNSDVTPAANLKKYWLGETYDQFLATQVTNTTAGDVYGLVAGLYTGSSPGGALDFDDHNSGFIDAQTPFVRSQDMGLKENFYVSEKQKLFKFISLGYGEWANNNLKISIENIKAAAYPEISPYGTFSVTVRHARDTDNAPIFLERFDNCSLNPNSEDYIARKIGDKYEQWSDTERRLRQYGTYDNKSDYIRVEVDAAVDNGSIDASLVPFGYMGPPRFKGFTFSDPGASGSQALISPTKGFGPVRFGALGYVAGPGTEAAQTFNSASSIVVAGTGVPNPTSASFGIGGVAGGFGYFATVMTERPDPESHATTGYTGSFLFPSIRLRLSASDGAMSDPTDAYFGIQTTQGADSLKFDPSYYDMVRPLSPLVTVSSFGTGYATENSFAFSMDDLVSGSGAGGGWFHLSGSRKAGNSYTAQSGNNFKSLLDQGFDRFTLPMHGGFDGLNVREAEPFRNTYLTDATNNTELSNYGINTVKRAIDTVRDPEVVEANLMTVPGVWAPALTDHLRTVCEERGDALAIMDIRYAYTPETEGTQFTDVTSRAPDISQAITTLRDRSINSSYACTFFPWVQIRDTLNGRLLPVPPSVAALGTFGSSQARTELWFAPAGFVRGGLSNGAAGIPVTGVKMRLTSKNRDDLYAANINPIATFPNEGIVIFGQKTLQITPSALDRINVRRLMIFVKKEISRIANSILFEPNVQVTWDRFTGAAEPFLADVKARFGLTDFRVILDKSTTTDDLIDRNILYAKIFLKPARAIEFIALDFIITRTGASFDD